MLLFYLLISIAFFSLGSEKKTFLFKLIGERIIIEIETENGKLNFIFDTASNVSAIDSSLAKKHAMSFGEMVSFPSNEGPLTGYYTNLNIFKSLTGLSCVIFPFDEISKNLNYKVHGLIGVAKIVEKNVIEIDFMNNVVSIGGTTEKSIEGHKLIQLNSVNRAYDGIGKFLPKLASIRDTIEFNNSHSEVIDLVIDTGSKFGLVFYSNDSLQINKLKSSIGTYKLINIERQIAYCYASLSDSFLQSEIYSAPIFHDPSILPKFSNSFFGLLGVPFLKTYKRIIIDYPHRELYLIK